MLILLLLIEIFGIFGNKIELIDSNQVNSLISFKKRYNSLIGGPCMQPTLISKLVTKRCFWSTLVANIISNMYILFSNKIEVIDSNTVA